MLIGLSRSKGPPACTHGAHPEVSKAVSPAARDAYRGPRPTGPVALGFGMPPSGRLCVDQPQTSPPAECHRPCPIIPFCVVGPTGYDPVPPKQPARESAAIKTPTLS